MLVFIESDLGSVFEKAFENDADFDARERRARADVLADFGAVERERGGVFPASWIAIGGGQREHDALACGNFDLADTSLFARDPERDLARSFEAQHLFEESGDQAAIVA
jgi:hypothetical protein